MDLKEQFRYEDFCLKFARHLFPVIGTEEITVKNEFGTKLYSGLNKIHLVHYCPGNITKADISFRVGCEYLNSYTLKGRTFVKDDLKGKDYLPYYCTKPLNIVVRKDVKMISTEIEKHMKESFKANILYLMRYSGDFDKNHTLKNDLYTKGIIVVYYHEINRHLSAEEQMDERFR